MKGQEARVRARGEGYLYALILSNAVTSSRCLDIVLWVPIAVKNNHLHTTHEHLKTTVTELRATIAA